jgi:hypothetical protein
MAEPLHEEEEESYIEALNRFEEHVWPLFEGRGITKGEAVLVWQLNRLANSVDDLAAELHDETAD